MQDLYFICADAVKYLVVMAADDFDANRRVGCLARAERAVRDAHNRRMNGIYDLARAGGAVFAQVSENGFKVGEGLLSVSHSPAMPNRSQNARTFSSEAMGLRRAASIATCSSSLRK